MKPNKIFWCLGLILGLSWAPFTLCAAEPAKGLMAEKKVSAGKEDVVAPGFEAAADLKAVAEAKDVTELKLSAGGLAAAGNSRSISGTASGKFRMRREANQLSVAVVGNYARSAPSPADSVQTTIQNVQGKARYDRFFSAHTAVFGAVSALNDRFMGLDLRLNFDPGASVYVISEAKQQLWAELGYDFQFDSRRDETLTAARAAGNVLDKTQLRHSARAFVGYSNTISQSITFDSGLEYLQGIPETKNWRLNWGVSLASTIAGKLSIAAAFNLKFDNHPLPGIESTDYLSSLSLVYQLL